MEGAATPTVKVEPGAAAGGGAGAAAAAAAEGPGMAEVNAIIDKLLAARGIRSSTAVQVRGILLLLLVVVVVCGVFTWEGIGRRGRGEFGVGWKRLF